MDLPDPVPGPTEVLLDVKAVALNHLDLWVRQGLAGLKLPLPHVLGSDVAGVISGMGRDVSDVNIGDAVVVAPGLCCGRCRRCLDGEDSLCAQYRILGEHARGGYAQKLCVSRANVLAKPTGLTFPQAAAFPLTFLTAWRMLRRANAQAGEVVLITGASSGVSVAGIQMARLRGCTVIAATRGPEKMQRALQLGAHHAVDSEGDLKSQVRAIAGGDGVDVVFEHVGGATFKAGLSVLRRGGRLVTCGATSGPVVEMDLRHIFIKQHSIIGSTMGSRGDLLELCTLIERGQLVPVVDQVLPLEEAAQAHRLLEERKHFGKVVLTP
jgi:NADPH:quinone reductase-like Zn-dependent oxidoreductase